jgi:hypothetical protein
MVHSMVSRLLLFIGSFILVVAVPIILVLAFITSYGEEQWQALQTAWIHAHPLLFIAIMAAYGGLTAYSFFWLQDWIFILRPKSGVAALPKTELTAQLLNTFAGKDDKGQPLFHVEQKNDKILIAWTGSLRFNQVISVGGRKLKEVFVLILDEKTHEVFVWTKEVDTSWTAGFSGLYGNFAWQKGFALVSHREYVPSLRREDGRYAFVIEKLAFDSTEIWNPIDRIVREGGWSIRVNLVRSVPLRLACAAAVAALLGLTAWVFTL